VIRLLMSLLLVAEAMSLEARLVSVALVAPVLLVDSLVAPTVLEGCSVVDFDVSVVATELLGVVLEVVVSAGWVELVLLVLAVVLDELGVVDEVEELGVVDEVEVSGVVVLDDVLGVLLATVELLELGEVEDELVLGVVELVVCCV
jgi:hypothetical protein